MGNQMDNFKKDKRVQKYMKQYRYNYGVKMLPDLAELAQSFYLEGYNNGLKQYDVTPISRETKADEVREER